MLSLKHAAPIRELSISALGLCLGLLMPGCTNDPVTSGPSSALAGRAASSAAGTGVAPSDPLAGTASSLPQTTVTPGQTSSTGAPVASNGAAGTAASEATIRPDSGTAGSAAGAGGSAGAAASDAGVAGAPSAAGSGGGPAAGSGGSAGAGDAGVMCENLACFDIFDCALYHLAEFGPCGFTKCDGFICKP